jgi:hypothetical protein
MLVMFEGFLYFRWGLRPFNVLRIFSWALHLHKIGRVLSLRMGIILLSLMLEMVGFEWMHLNA